MKKYWKKNVISSMMNWIVSTFKDTLVSFFYALTPVPENPQICHIVYTDNREVRGEQRHA